jgi:hypothetical protein
MASVPLPLRNSVKVLTHSSSTFSASPVYILLLARDGGVANLFLPHPLYQRLDYHCALVSVPGCISSANRTRSARIPLVYCTTYSESAAMVSLSNITAVIVHSTRSSAAVLGWSHNFSLPFFDRLKQVDTGPKPYKEAPLRERC